MSCIRQLSTAVAVAFTPLLLTGCSETPSFPSTTITTTVTTTTTTTTTLPGTLGCICIFDVDRTLTAIQKGVFEKEGEEYPCKDAPKEVGVDDTSYGCKGDCTMRLSNLGANFSNSSKCNKCYHGIVSADEAGGKGSKERAFLLKLLGGKEKTLSEQWSDTEPFDDIQSLVLGYPDMKKHKAVAKIVEFIRNQTSHVTTIPDSAVWFFDDREDNIKPFVGGPYNAQQVSCGSRDKPQAKIVGLCGATLSEIDNAPGKVNFCKNANHVDESEDLLV